MTVAIPPELGTKVVSRTISWRDQALRAWNGEYQAPDRNVYQFSNGRGFDSTDQTFSGIYQRNAP